MIWKEVYYQLGRNENTPLSDDEFLRAHWIMYFSFDVMYARKDNIEKHVPYNIGWNRGDDKRSSTVNVEIEDVDFNDTSRWPELTQFLATTCVALKAELITACEDELRVVIDGN